MRESDRERETAEQQGAADFLHIAHDTAGLGESFEMTLLPEYTKGRRSPSVGPRARSQHQFARTGVKRPMVREDGRKTPC